METLERIVDEVHAGLKKLDAGDMWTVNSNWASMLLLALVLNLLGIGYFFIEIYAQVKWKIVMRIIRR